MDKDIISNGYIDVSKTICVKCEHWVENNLDLKNFGCRAFPGGVPREMLLKKKHDMPVAGQVGDFVFKKAKHNYFQNFDFD